MNLTPSAEAIAIRDTVLALVADVSEDKLEAGDDLLRARATELGLPLLLLPESLGGLGLELSVAAMALEALGRRPTRQPWITDIVAFPTLLHSLADMPAAEDLTRDLLSRADRITLARPMPSPAPRAQRVDLTTTVLDVRHDHLQSWSAEAWQQSAARSFTGHHDLWCTTHNPKRLTDLPRGTADSLLVACRIGAAAFVLGSARAALDLSVEHVKSREQFGRPVGSFQAVKHLLASALESITMAAPLVDAAAFAVSTRQASGHVDAALALRQATRAAADTVRIAIQVHGAIGYTDEVPLGGLLGQIRATTDYWGPSGALSDVLARELLGEGAGQ